MMHRISELYRIVGKDGLYTKDYLVANNIDHGERRKGYHPSAFSAIRINYEPKGYININTAEGKVRVYVYGTLVWFETPEERDEYKVKITAHETAKAYRNKVKKNINDILDEMSTEQLEMLLTKLS